MRKFLFTLLFIFMLGDTAFGQAYIQNTMYNFTRFIYNPAVAGTEGRTSLTMLGRLQWLGIDGGPRLISASLNGQIGDFGGIGGYAIRDELGPLSNTGINLAYSYHQDVGLYGSTISIGVEGGYFQRSLRAIWKYPAGLIDPIVGPANSNFAASVGSPNLGAGIYYRHMDQDGETERFFVGISGHDLLEPSIDDLTLAPGTGEDSNVPRTFYLMAGYRFDLGFDAYIQPTILGRTDGNIYQFDVSAYVKYKPIIFGVNYRWDDSFSGIVAFDVSDRTLIGYSYDYGISGLNNNGDGSSHEIVITYKFSGGGKYGPVDEQPINPTISGGN